MAYNHKKIERKWAEKWVKDKTFTTDLEKAKNPYYALFMFPYPSGEGLHFGHAFVCGAVDAMAKYKKLKGFDVFEPIGWDAFGIHSENYALKIGENPRSMLDRTTKNFRRQLQSLGIGCDWTREVDTTTLEYYKWTQWIFIKLFEKGLAVQKEALLHWCPSCKTVLADEQIESGVCERCKTIPEKKKMKQWFFKITDFSQRLLDGLDDMDWSEITKSAQRNWIGRSEGALIKFQISNFPWPSAVANSGLGKFQIEVFTTRPDTLLGATYFVLSPEHPMVEQITTDEQKEEVGKYTKEAMAKSDLARTEAKEKTGVFTGAYVINPVNNEKIPVWVADYVLPDYGTGAIMAVPARDQRDCEFAQKYNLPIVEAELREDMIEWLEKNGVGKARTNYKLRDWCISRQRYWGPPIPIMYCSKCGPVVVPEKDLPVELPDMKEGWEPAGDGRGPLAKVEDFVNTVCPKCGGPAKRETDVMDNFLDSAWYYYRYLSPNDEGQPFDKLRARKWLPVDIYIGGNEHAVLHLMYTRFITMTLRDLGMVDFDDPFKKFRANGMILKDGTKMSKSKGNVVNPEEYGEKIGYDALKTYLLFLGPLSEDRSFSDDGVLGTKRWVERIARIEEKIGKDIEDKEVVIKKLHKTIKQVEEDFEEQKYNTAIARLMELTNILTVQQKVSKDTWEKFLSIIAPFVPALADEMWSKQGNNGSIFENRNWPKYNPEKIKEDILELVVQINGKFRGNVMVPKDMDQKEAEKSVLSNSKFDKYLKNMSIKDIIFIKNRLINFVAD